MKAKKEQKPGAGKGDSPRPGKNYAENYVGIKWKSKLQTLTAKQKLRKI